MSVVTPIIQSEGKAVDITGVLLSLDIAREVNRIPYAQLKLVDGDIPRRTFAIVSGGHFALGKPIEIGLRLEGGAAEEMKVFSGLVVKQAIEIAGTEAELTVELKDAAVMLTRVPRSQVFAESDDGTAIRQLVEAGGLQVGDIAATKAHYRQLVQHECTDWDYILCRAEANGLLVCAEDGVLSLRPMAPRGQAGKSFELGIDDIYSLELEAGAEGQYGEVTGSAWEPASQKMSPPVSAKPANVVPGNLDGAALAELLGGGGPLLADSCPAPAEELQAWADATMARSRLELVRGRIAVPGFADCKLMETIELKGLGAQYSGKSTVTGLRHRITRHGWTTDLQFGLSPAWFPSRPDPGARPAAGLIPPIGGLHIGVVDAFMEDPDKELRVQVRVPAWGEDQVALWARLAAPDAGKGRGFFVRPEAGDEVLLGFLNDDPRQPVILGGLFSSANPPPAGYETPSDKNPLKGWITRAGTKIGFDDQDPGKAAMCIETAGGHRVRLDDGAKSITLADSEGNAVTLDANGIGLKSPKDIRIEAGAGLSLKAGAALTVEGNTVTVKGSTVDIQ